MVPTLLSYLLSVIIMSAVNFYKIMENKKNTIQGSNALNNLFTENGRFYIESLLEKDLVNGVNLMSESPLTDSLSQHWFNENNPFTSVYNVNSNDILNTLEFEDDKYSLDNLLDDDQNTLSPSSSSVASSDVLETPVASPLMSIDFEFESLFQVNSASQENYDDLSKNENCIPSCSDDYDLNPLKMSNEDFHSLHPGSPDSGISSADELSVDSDSSDMIFQLFENDVSMEEAPVKTNMTITLPPMEKQFPGKEINPQEVTERKEVHVSNFLTSEFNFDNATTKVLPSKLHSERNSPYKRKQKTEEQKYRKKAQNRNAASRYRHKKKGEYEELRKIEEDHETKNKELKEKVHSLTNEIDYLKKLMLDVINARLANSKKVIGNSSTNINQKLNILLQAS